MEHTYSSTVALPLAQGLIGKIDPAQTEALAEEDECSPAERLPSAHTGHP